MKSQYKIIIITLILAALAYLSYGFIYWWKKGSEKRTTCQYLNNNRFGKDIIFVDCFGIFSIEHEFPWLDGKRLSIYDIRDDKHNYNISILNSLKNYKIENGFMYIHEPLIFPINQYAHVKFGDKEWQFPREFFLNGEIKEINYKSPEDFPNYIQVEMVTGEVTLYNTYDQMPDEVENIFKSLEQ